MSALNSPAIRVVGLMIVLAAGAGAQAPKQCEVNESRPTQIGRATLAVQIASSQQSNPQAAAKQLSSAVKLLTDNGDKMENQTGRNLVLGKALVLWSTLPNVELVTKRGPLGYSTNPDSTISPRPSTPPSRSWRPRTPSASARPPSGAARRPGSTW